jgi:hypothetical protein
MPNYVKNKVIVQHEKLEDIANFMEGEDGAFDFNNLVPMPEELKGIQCMHDGLNGTIFYRLEDLEKADAKDLVFADTEGNYKIPTPEWIRENKIDAFTVRRLYKDYGAAFWHEWCTENWGTKWPASEVDTKMVADRLVFDFVTAWDPPFPIIKKFFEHAKKTGGKVEWQYQYEDGFLEEIASVHTINSEQELL